MRTAWNIVVASFLTMEVQTDKGKKNKEEEEERQVLWMRCERKRGPESKMKRTIRRSG